MTLRFFRRKSGAAADESIDPPSDKPVAEKKPSRRRRGGSSSDNKAKAAAKTAAEKDTATDNKSTTSPRAASPRKPAATDDSEASKKPSTTRTRRGHRGGARRSGGGRAAGKQAAEATDLPIDSGKAATVDGLLSQQQTAIQELVAQQVATLKGLQGSLSAIENRLNNGGDRSSALAVRPRVAVFVDVPNIMYAAERERVVLDYGKVLDFIIGNREMVRASAYAPISDDPDEKLETQKFVQPFVDLGYRIVTKPLKRYANGSIKANFDVELAIDVLTMSDRLDIVVLMSGDGDFRRLVELVESKGVRVEVVAFGPSTAAELRTVADEYTDLNDHLKELCVTKK
ncbi:MAG: NYN domain-containing protein [Chloroflexi bacterium]|nr:NYN domain-containing protein [Chloroflexota bacterium]